MKITVVLVGHTRLKMDRLVNLYKLNKPLIKHKLVIVYNGEGFYDAEILCKNNKQGRDVAMYRKAIEFEPSDFYFFMNDDVCYIQDGLWLDHAISLKTEVVAVQTNLASVVPHRIIKKVRGSIPTHHKRQGTTPKFIRTSAFGCTKEYFERVWEHAKGSAQRFEKATLKLANNVGYFMDSFYIYDENLKPYIKEMLK